MNAPLVASSFLWALAASAATPAAPPRPPGLKLDDLRVIAAECGGRSVTISGTQEADEIVGTDGDDVIHGLAGKDVIRAGRGNDVVCGGEGDDDIWLDDGTDTAYGGDGGDIIHGGSDRDVIHGEMGPDHVFGEGGGDVLYGDEGQDRVYGDCPPPKKEIDKEPVAAWARPDDCVLFAGDDTLWGGDAADELVGGNGDDSLWGGAGEDRLYGEAGHDVLSCGGDPGDHASGGADRDTFAHDSDDCTTHESVGGVNFTLAKDPLGADGLTTVTDDRSFVVAGCVPIHWRDVPGDRQGAGGSIWVQCNDLDFVKDKVVQSDFVSCLEHYPNGVLSGFVLSEVRNRRWEFFRFSCRDLQDDGTMGAASEKTARLFDFDKSGDVFDTLVPLDHLAVGVLEIWNQLQFVRRENLLQIGITHQRAAAIFDAGKEGKVAADLQVTPRIPKASPALANLTSWNCPAGMVMTGAAIGHIPKGNENKTRPVYILGECRRLLKGD